MCLGVECLRGGTAVHLRMEGTIQRLPIISLENSQSTLQVVGSPGTTIYIPEASHISNILVYFERTVNPSISLDKRLDSTNPLSMEIENSKSIQETNKYEKSPNPPKDEVRTSSNSITIRFRTSQRMRSLRTHQITLYFSGDSVMV